MLGLRVGGRAVERPLLELQIVQVELAGIVGSNVHNAGIFAVFGMLARRRGEHERGEKRTSLS